MPAHFPHDAENTLTQARDFAAAERTFGSAIKLVIALTIVAGNYILRSSDSDRPRIDSSLGGLLFGVALILLSITLYSYFRSVKRYSHDAFSVESPLWVLILVLAVAFLALAITIAEFVLSPESLE